MKKTVPEHGRLGIAGYIDLLPARQKEIISPNIVMVAEQILEFRRDFHVQGTRVNQVGHHRRDVEQRVIIETSPMVHYADKTGGKAEDHPWIN